MFRAIRLRWPEISPLCCRRYGIEEVHLFDLFPETFTSKRGTADALTAFTPSKFLVDDGGDGGPGTERDPRWGLLVVARNAT